MFRFENINILFFLLAIPLLYVGYYLYLKNFKSRLKKYGNPQLIRQLAPQFSTSRPFFKFTTLMLVLFLLIIALARPQFGSKLKEIKREGIELVIALDVSNSMMAEDIAPNRLARAKQAINTLVTKMNDDKIGLIIFAGDAYTQLPITGDYTSAKMFLSNISPDIVSKQGTAIGKAIDLGMRSFTQNEESAKVIVIISDGEDHEGDAVDAARLANEKGIIVHTIGMGSSRGAVIPAKNGRGFIKDNQGNPVTSRMNPEMLSSIAKTGGGKFYKASTGTIGLSKLYSELQKLQKTEIETQVYSEYDDQYAYFVLLALILLVAELFILERKNKWLSGLKIFGQE
jgi:Ca-activated chloride channel family protein